MVDGSSAGGYTRTRDQGSQGLSPRRRTRPTAWPGSSIDAFLSDRMVDDEIADVVEINWTNGGAERRVDLSLDEPITISIMQPPGSLVPSAFVLFGSISALVHEDESTNAPGDEACRLLPSMIDPFAPGGFLLANSFGADPPGLVSATPAPWTFTLTTGVPFPLRLSLQGVVSHDSGTVAVTNGIVLSAR